MEFQRIGVVQARIHRGERADVSACATATSDDALRIDAELARVLDPDGRGNPLAGCGVIVDATSIGRDPTAHKHGQGGSGDSLYS